ncbi:Hypothetical predicted protein [Octopus vulgaris]|nr:Hypothetical predicted protein [Octopus vulgaris]
MISTFKYTSMTITGALHLVLGILGFIISIVGFSVKAYSIRRIYDYSNDNYIIYYYPNEAVAAGSFCVSLWIIAVGIIGIITGQKSNSNSKTQKMRLVYLIFTILSAVVFSLGGITAFTVQGIWMADTDSYVYFIFFFGVFIMIVEFVLAIVSSSISCCCSGIGENAVETQGPEVCQVANTNVPPVVVCSPDAVAPHMPPQYTVYPPYVAGAQMPPQYTAYVPNVDENAMAASKTQ